MTPDSPYIEDESRWTEAQAYIAALEAELGLDGTADVQTKMNLPDYAPRSAPMWQRLEKAELRADALADALKSALQVVQDDRKLLVDSLREENL